MGAGGRRGRWPCGAGPPGSRTAVAPRAVRPRAGQTGRCPRPPRDLMASAIHELQGRRPPARASSPAVARAANAWWCSLDGAERLRGLPGVATLLQDGPDVGVVFARSTAPLTGCPARQVRRSSSAPVRARAAAQQERRGGPWLVVDGVGEWWAERLSRALAPLRDATPHRANGTLPEDARCSTSSGDAAPEQLAAQWAALPHTTRAVSAAARLVHTSSTFRTDGPHILVGGTTGSGKSEFLQTLIASLAVANRPTGSRSSSWTTRAAQRSRRCAALPHTAGLVTDLDAHLTERALDSLTAELTRREALFAAVGATDLDGYERLAAGGPSPVIPGWSSSSTSSASSPRSCPPSSPGWSGSRRSGARSESTSSATAPRRGRHQRHQGQRQPPHRPADARPRGLRRRHRLPRGGPAEWAPGRAWRAVVVAPSRCSRAHGSVAAPGHRARIAVTPLDWLSPPAPRPLAAPRAGSSTDLQRIVAVLQQAAACPARHPRRHRGSRPCPTPSPCGPAAAPGQQSVGPRRGLADRPASQRQDSLVWDLRSPGHWAAVGTAGSGKTCSDSLLPQRPGVSPAEVHLYAVDGGGGGLRCWRVCPIPGQWSSTVTCPAGAAGPAPGRGGHPAEGTVSERGYASWPSGGTAAQTRRRRRCCSCWTAGRLSARRPMPWTTGR